jgi:hypothetical protein
MADTQKQKRIGRLSGVSGGVQSVCEEYFQPDQRDQQEQTDR